MPLARRDIRAILENAELSVEERIDRIIDGHLETVNGLKADVTRYKADADRLSEVQRELDGLKNGEDWKAKYEKEHSDFEAHKANQSKEKTRAAKEAAYRAQLSAAGIDDKRIGTIVKASGAAIDALELNDDGTAKNADKLAESIKTEWGDLITTTVETGVNTPAGGSGKSGAATMTKADIMKIRDAGERQKAIAENITLFKGE